MFKLVLKHLKKLKFRLISRLKKSLNLRLNSFRSRYLALMIANGNHGRLNKGLNFLRNAQKHVLLVNFREQKLKTKELQQEAD